jgi:hypothetical protein
MVMRAHLKKTEISEAVLNYLIENGPKTLVEIHRELPQFTKEQISYTLMKLNGWRVKTITIGRNKKAWRFIR